MFLGEMLTVAGAARSTDGIKLLLQPRNVILGKLDAKVQVDICSSRTRVCKTVGDAAAGLKDKHAARDGFRACQADERRDDPSDYDHDGLIIGRNTEAKLGTASY